MKRDVWIALAIGFLLGSLVAILVINLPTILKERRATVLVSPTPTPAVTKTTSEKGLLEIEQPVDGSLSETKTVALLGKTRPGNTIVIETDLDSKIIEATAGGSFTSQITLGEGGNNIYITAYDGEGEGQTKIITVFYTLEKL